jgi:hypothetical protein
MELLEVIHDLFTADCALENREEPGARLAAFAYLWGAS